MSLSYAQVFFIIEGVGVTLKYSLVSVLCGLIIGSLLAIAKVGKVSSLKILADLYTSVFRGTPLMIQLMIIYNVLPQVIGVKLSIFSSGIIAFSLNSGAYTSEVIRAGIEAVDEGQFEAAKALGIPYYLMMKDIILPQALVKILPSLVNELVNIVKESAIISMIGEVDLMRRAHLVSIESYNYLAPMLIAASCYYLVVISLSRFAVIVEKRIKYD